MIKVLKQVQVGKRTISVWSYEKPTQPSTLHWREMEEGKEKYKCYLESTEWKNLRRTVMKRCNKVCERCNLFTASQVHHKDYHNLYAEDLTDLLGICDGCHRCLHNLQSNDPIDIARSEGVWDEDAENK
jgi:hypothetical protein